VYLAEHPALTVLEVRVHLDLSLELLPEDYVLARIRLPDEPPETAAPTDDCAAVGNTWLHEGFTATLRVPSMLVPHAWNLLLNPRHRRATEAEIVGLTPFRFDPRLWPDQTNPRQGSTTNA
jgi:RES domain-containing protein